MSEDLAWRARENSRRQRAGESPLPFLSTDHPLWATSAGWGDSWDDWRRLNFGDAAVDEMVAGREASRAEADPPAVVVQQELDGAQETIKKQIQHISRQNMLIDQLMFELKASREELSRRGRSDRREATGADADAR
jgi:hypothetical protein